MWRPVRDVGTEVADGRKSLLEQVISSSQAGAVGVGVVRPETNGPHRIKKGWLRLNFYYQCPKGSIL